MSVFIRDIAVSFFVFLLMSLSGFGIRIILAHRMRWETFGKDWVNSVLNDW